MGLNRTKGRERRNSLFASFLQAWIGTTHLTFHSPWTGISAIGYPLGTQTWTELYQSTGFFVPPVCRHQIVELLRFCNCVSQWIPHDFFLSLPPSTSLSPSLSTCLYLLLILFLWRTLTNTVAELYHCTWIQSIKLPCDIVSTNFFHQDRIKKYKLPYCEQPYYLSSAIYSPTPYNSFLPL